MPDFELIDPSAVPVSAYNGTAIVYLEECERHLRAAMQAGKALVVRLRVDERPERYRDYLRKVARKLELKLVVTTGGSPRTRRTASGRDVVENPVMYVRIRRTTAPRDVPQPAAEPSPALPATIPHPGRLPSAPSPNRGPLDGFRYEEPKKRGRPPKFSIPTPQPGYQALSHGIEVDR